MLMYIHTIQSTRKSYRNSILPQGELFSPFKITAVCRGSSSSSSAIISLNSNVGFIAINWKL